MTIPAAPRPCAALLLTGGASRRFGSPKADLVVDGARLADRIAAALVAVADPVLEVGPGASALESVRERPSGSGPLVAVAAGAEALGERRAGDRPVLVVAVDLPFADVAIFQLLRDHPASDAVVPMLDGRAQPLCARYPREVAASARELVNRGERAVRALLDVLPVTYVDEAAWTIVADRTALADVDTRDDARRLGLDVPE